MELTIQEILKMAAVDTVLGMGTVFSVLILISLVIWTLGKALKEKDPAASAAAAAPAAAATPKAKSSDADAEIVAAISAAISQFIKNQYGQEAVDEGQYIVRNIRRASWKHIS